MLYQKEIDDSVLIQFIILYTLCNTDEPVAYNSLINLVMDNCNINYNDFQISLENLVSTNHVHKYIESGHNQKYKITPKGMAAGEFFAVHIPVYIREPILESIKKLFLEERRKNAIQSDIVPVRKNEYNAECRLLDDDKTEIMNLSLYAGSREEAEKIAIYFKDHSEEVYERIVSAFSDDDSEQ